MNSKKNLKRNLLICLLAGSAVMYTLPLHAATSVIANNTLPTGGKVFAGDIKIPDWAKPGETNPTGNLEMNIIQSSTNGVIKWESFDVGGSATVNFKGPQVEGGYNTLNYVNAGGSMSQIYGTINANNNGNIFIVNPAGVQIGNSAQINVGSLYVSSNTLSDAKLSKFYDDAGNTGFNLGGTRNADIELMSLGNINAGKVTFEGDGRIVIDSERIKDVAGTEKLTADKIFVNTKDENNLVIGYDGYDENNGGSYNTASEDINIVTVNGNGFAQNKGYMWVEDVEQLQDIGENDKTLSGNYALRNSIDATSTANWNEVNDTYEGFNPIGLDEKTGKVIVNDNNENGFTGNFDGLDYNIFGLTINRENEANVGLFGVAHNANINNVTLVGGSITGGSVVGSVVGAALGNTHITNATNSASVTGNTDVGGIVGYSGDDINDGAGGKITVSDSDTYAHFTNLINTGAVHSKGEDDEQGGIVSNAGGLIGYMYNGTLDGNSYNLGDVSGKGYNVGGLVGYAVNSTIGNPSVVNEKPVENVQVVYNRLDVEGKYNVGGIVGNMEGTTVQNAENSGNVTASGYTIGEYTYHTGETVPGNIPNGTLNGDGTVTASVNIANAGGIVGTVSNNSTIKDVTNSADVSSNSLIYEQNNKQNIYYTAGNVGGVVGSAVNTNITNATNKENDVRGAHNVGGVAGYFGGSATITGGINDGGDIMATGARDANEFVTETVRPVGDANESFIIGNIGGVVGYLDGDNVYVTGSANRGTVHTDEPADPAHVEAWQKAANVGGVVGKIDRGTPNTLDGIEKGNEKAAVTNSYNTGDVLGYTGVGGVIGMMYNGAVSGSYNLGTVNTTRQVDRSGGSNIDPLNMGGIVGDTTEETNAKAIIYDVYNKGQIGDEEFNYYARHVGGIVGRLSGYVEKAYNTGDIYNNDTVVGGIAGWWYSGTIKNAFNTGNITAITATELQVGGLVGAAGANANSLTNAYNLGTIRGYQQANNQAIYLGGIVGKAAKLSIDNVYTLGNLYAGRGSNTYTKVDNGVGYIYGGNYNQNISVKNSYYITSEDTNSFSKGNGYGETQVDFGNRYDKNSYGDFSFSTQTDGIVSDNEVWRIYEGSTTPILNAFLPNTEKYFGNKTQNPDAMNNIDSIQYGTAYDPLLTIINAKDNLIFDWDKLGIGGAGSLVVYGGSLTLDNVSTSNATGGSSYYGGVLYSDGALTIKGNENENLGFGSASELYGSEVTIKADGTVTIYGDVTATGNANDNDTTGNVTINAGDVNVYGTLTSATIGKDVSISGIANKGNGELTFNDVNNPYSAMPHVGDRFNINITAKDNIDGDITITAGQNNTGNGNVNLYFGNKEEGLITTGGNLTVTGTGDVYVDSDLDIAGNMTLTSTGKDGEVLLTLTNIGKVQADRFTEVIEKAINGIEVTEANKNKLIDVINSAVGKEFPDLGFSDDPQKAEAIVTTLLKGNNKVEAIDTLNNDVAIEYMHDFMHSFERSNNQDTPDITLSSASGNSKLTVDMWEDNDNGTGQFNFEKYDSNSIYTSDEHTFVEELNNLNLTINDNSNIDAADVVYVEVHNGEQLKGIQSAGNDALGYNYALMGDINASDVTDYEAIGTNSANGFTGTFDGRGNRIIGLKVSGDNAGIFSEIGTRTENINGEIVTHTGTVKNVNIYSGNFTGGNSAGAVAGVNSGRIENVTGFGNTVTVTGDANNAGNAGGIVGVNNGKSDFETSDGGASTLTGNGIYDVQNVGSVIAGGNKVVAGGLVGTNNGALGNSYSDSAVTVETGITLDKDTTALGGVAGVNTQNGDVQYVDSLGVTNGGTSSSSNVGGIIGVNNGNMYSGYNESIVSGSSNVGGIIGQNDGGTNYTVDTADGTITWNKGTVENVVNATGVTGSSNYVGGLVGTNTGSVTNGRNNGTITGTNYVGGLVGDNADEHSILTNLVNDSSAEILGEQYVGGIAGSNSGTITADKANNNLINRGSITGYQYVGGVAGLNTGVITNTNNDVELYVNTSAGDEAKYFGGVVGQNGIVASTGTEANDGIIENATNTNKITAPDAAYVGGIVGWNTSEGKLIGMGNSNEGEVIGGSFVGGVIGKNDAAIGGKNAAQVGIKNEGIVIATQGGAGGLIGENNAAITNTVMTNKGEVHGNIANDGSGTGGLIGTNNENGDITYSSMINEVTGTVTGVNNVGGLIGVNKADITGGRENTDGTDAGMYINKIFNNGVIEVGSYTDADDDGKYEFAASNGQNIGGLFGNNSGTVKAAYNTGAINAANSENVGGIAGSNSGTIDQVFNTVYNTDGTNGAITGGTNVGGLVGTNSGTLSNAYNTTGVEGAKGSTGNAVGVNDTNGIIENIYASNTSGNLIGNAQGNINNAYSFSSEDEGKFVDNVDTDNDGIKDRVDKDSYTGFDFTNDWKNYDGSGNPLLKVFLTTVTVDTDKLPDIVYNTKDQDLNIGSLTGTGGAFSAADDFKAYQNNNSLIQNTDFEHKNAGTYDNWLYSGQIASGSQEEGTFNPNNLGYDIEFKADIDKAQITVDLNQVDRVYGNTDIINGEYGFSYGFNNVLSDADKTALRDELDKKNVLNMNTVNASHDDTALVEIGTKTNDAGSYDWTGTVNIAENYQGNYEFVVKDTGTIDNEGATITTTGDSIVNKRKLSVSDITANIVYGNQDGKGFIVSGGELIGINGNTGIVYDDKVMLDTSLEVEDANIIANSSYASNKGNRVTADAGTYENSLNFSGLGLSGDDANNYVLVNDRFGGTIEVTQATINVDLNDVDRTYGSTAFNGNGYAVSNVQNNANNDSYNADDFVVSVNIGNDGALTGNDTGKVTNDVGEYSYIGTVISNNEKLNQNYKIVVNNSEANNNIGSGISTVIKADLSVTINNVDTTYGTAFDESKYGYTLDNLANGDGNSSDIVNAIENAINNASGGYNNTGAADGTNGKVTQDAEGDYSLSFKNDITQKDVLTNYNITVVNDGDVNVSKKQIHIGANSEAIQVGGTPDYTGTDINDVLVNGDKLNGDYYYGVENSADEKVVGNHSIGVWIGNTFYDLSETVDWTNVDGFFSNYEVTYNPGTLTVTEQIMPDLPDNWPNNRWDYLFGDNPFDRNENFRERKAEVNFVDGAMEI